MNIQRKSIFPALFISVAILAALALVPGLLDWLAGPGAGAGGCVAVGAIVAWVAMTMVIK